MNKHLTVLAIALFAATLLGSNQALATTYYVRVGGDDGNNGLAPSTAFGTIRKAAQVMQSGDRVYVGAGYYTDHIFVDGIQQSTSPAEFIADSAGTFTGDSGAVIVADAQWKVVNSNHVQITGFTFQGATTRFFVWKGSYEGLLADCQFTAGDEGLLIKEGSLIIDNCQLQNFAHDGIQVDGTADLLLRDSTISGCQESGVEIRKVARVTIDNCTLDGNLGNGVAVAITTDTVDDGPPLPTVGKEYLLAALDKFNMSSGFIKGYNSEVGPSSIGATGVASCNGDIQMSGSSYVYGDAYTQGNVDPSRVSGTVYTLAEPLAAAPVDFGDAPTNNNNDNIPLSDGGNDPLDPGLIFKLSGGDGIDLPPGRYYFSKMTLSGGSTIRISGPTIIYCTGPLDLSGGSIANPLQKPGDFQIRATDNIKLSGSSTFYGALYAPEHKIDLSGSSGIYGMAVGLQISSSADGGIYVDEALLPLASQLVGGASGSSSSPAPPAGWTPISSGELDINNSTLSANGDGVSVDTAQSCSLQFTQFINNSGWGLRLAGDCQLQNCTISDNAAGGVWLKDVTDADLLVTNLTISNSGQYGLFAETSDLSFDATNIGNWSISGCDHAFAASGGSMTFDGVTISGGTTAGVFGYNAALTVRNSTFQNNGYGVAADNSTVLVENSILAQNNVGLYSNQNTLTVRNSAIRNNTVWGGAVYASTAPGVTAVVENSTFDGNAGGLTLVNAADGDVQLRSGTIIRDNTNAGLHFANCNLTLNDQAGGANWRTLRNGYGLSGENSTLTLENVSVEQSTSYAIYSTTSDLTVRGCSLTGRDGIYLGNNNASTIDSSYLVTTVVGVASRGVYRVEGNLRITNSVIYGFEYGLHLSAGGSATADVLSTTIVNVTHYGVYVENGSAQLVNSIVVGNSGQYGLAVSGAGQLTHSHNLIHGFNTPYLGTAADDTEVLKNPRFADASGGDYHLAVGSPAINAGMDLSTQIASDIEGNLRPSFQRFEIGAYEYTSQNGSLRILQWEEMR